MSAEEVRGFHRFYQRKCELLDFEGQDPGPRLVLVPLGGDGLLQRDAVGRDRSLFRRCDQPGDSKDSQARSKRSRFSFV